MMEFQRRPVTGGSVDCKISFSNPKLEAIFMREQLLEWCKIHFSREQSLSYTAMLAVHDLGFVVPIQAMKHAIQILATRLFLEETFRESQLPEPVAEVMRPRSK